MRLPPRALVIAVLPAVASAACQDDRALVGALRFTDVTARAGLGYTAPSYDAAFADVDGDGDPDLLVSDHGRLRLFANDGRGRFDDASERYGLSRRADYHGFALGDVNRDGHPDLYATVGDVRGADAIPNELWLGSGDRFALAQAVLVAEDPAGRARGAAFAGLDGNPFVDAVVANFATPPAICLSDGGVLADRARALGLGVLGHLVCIDDFDGDGRLDLLFSGAARARILFADGDGFREQEVEGSGGWLGVAAGDLDGDGHVDLVAARYAADGDLALREGDELRARIRRDAGRAKELTIALDGDAVALLVEASGRWWSPPGAPARAGPPPFEPFELARLQQRTDPAASGEVQVWRRGDRELVISIPAGSDPDPVMVRARGPIAAHRGEGLVTADPRVPLDVRRGDGAGRFAPWRAAGLDVPAAGAAPLVDDIDNDGSLDIYLVCSGDRLFHSENRLFLNRGHGSFVECAAATGAAGPPPGVSFGACLGDVDGDGDLDAFLVKGDLPPGWGGGPRVLLRNELAPGRHWLDVLPCRADHGVVHGANVTVRAGTRSWTRRFALEGHPQSRGLRPCHFGLGDLTAVDEVRVDYPDGRAHTVRAPAIDRTLRVTLE